MRVKRTGTGGGFSLLEIIVCLGLISVVLVAVFGVQARNIGLQEEAMFIQKASLLAGERLSSMRAKETLLPGTFSEKLRGRDSRYRFKVEISPTPEMEDLYRISIQITSDDHKCMKAYCLRTYLFRVSP